ncbi:efflux RND transporter periplasmic adaptor subunit [Halomonas sp. ZH2S]|uniref:Efflux RND transporter periplasmic adaptor subunit n=1 Tax=Vreelandella zhuhanensis TaxID=2684210 RepID=A0A7X3H0K4_9GAMM|nr:efflux RND transporter periplasmic adaptor subunit [Halomonas zhuhanensis]MWJ28325.1 efflux RND transporter periplasmic adaptor subunit [Halomonas zhuhanensis]
MKGLFRLLLTLAALFILTGFMLTGCSDEAPEPTEETAATPTVNVGEIVEWRHPSTDQLPGVVSPGKRAVLSTRVSGTLTSVPASPGDRVEKDDLLATVDAREVEAAISAAQEKVTAAQAALQQARLNSQRLQRLYAEDLIARVRTEQADVRVSELEAQLQAAQSELKAQQANRSYTRLTAPFAGQVTETLLDTGSFVGPGQPLVVLEERRRLQIDVPVSSERVEVLTPGQQLSVLSGSDGTMTEARLVSIIPALNDEGTGQRLRLSVDDPPKGLRPGQVVRVIVPAQRFGRQGSGDAWVGLPQAALIRRGQLTGVLVVDDSNEQPTLNLRWIKTIAPPADADNLIPVTQGLAVGELVVLDPSPELQDGQTVSIQRADQNLGEE